MQPHHIDDDFLSRMAGRKSTQIFNKSYQKHSNKGSLASNRSSKQRKELNSNSDIFVDDFRCPSPVHFWQKRKKKQSKNFSHMRKS